MLFKALTVAAAIGAAIAQRPENTSVCDYYTTALLKNNTAANQYTLLTLVVNTAVIGNYTMPNVGIAVPGILAPGEFNGTKVALAGYFNGGFASSNRGGSSGVAVNFLDDGGAMPLLNNTLPTNTSSAEYRLVTHLYEYFGTLLGCSMQGMDGFPAYNGSNSMYEVHKFMGLSYAEVGYFITQVGLSAASFGVATEDVQTVGMALGKLFNYRCEPEMVVIPSQPAALQSICIDDTCPQAPNATCDKYEPVKEPAVANATLVGNTTMMSNSSSSSSSMMPSGTSSSGSGSGSGGSMTSSGSSGSSSPSSTGVTTNDAVLLQGGFAAAAGLMAMAFFL